MPKFDEKMNRYAVRLREEEKNLSLIRRRYILASLIAGGSGVVCLVLVYWEKISAFF